MEATDRALLERWNSARDAESFLELTKRYSGMVYATCRRVAGSAAAEDVAQECFEVLARKAPPRGDILGPWLHRVATTRSLNHIKAERRRNARERRFASEQVAIVESQWDDVYEHVDEAIDALPDHLRAPIWAHFFEEKTHDAIATSLGVSRQTVTYRIQNGITEIRKHLKRRGVAIAAPALAGMLTAHMAEAATAPAALAATLSKLALAGPASGAATGSVAANVIGGAFVMKKAIAAIVVLVAALGGAYVIWSVEPDPSNRTETRAEAEAPSPAQGVVTASGSDTQKPAGSASPEKPQIAARAAVEGGPEADSPPRRRRAIPTGDCTVSGRVLRAGTGEPVTHFEIGYSRSAVPNLAITIDEAKGTTESVHDLEGRFELRQVLLDRDIAVLARAPGLAHGLAVVPASPPKSSIEDVEIRLAPGSTVEGVVLDETRAPVAGADIATGMILVENGRTSPGLAKSDADGTFRIENLPPETFIVVAFHPDYAPGYADVKVEPREPTQVDIILVAGGTIRGIVTKNGEPLPMQLIRAQCSVTESCAMFRTFSRDDGTYVLTGLPEGEANVWAMQRPIEDGRRPRSLNKAVLIAPKTEIAADFDFTSDAGIEGTIFVDGQPCAARLHFSVQTPDGSWEEYHGKTDETGNYRLASLPAGLVTIKAYPLVRVTESEAVAWQDHLDATSGQVTRHDVHVGVGGTISGEITGMQEGEEAFVIALQGDIPIATYDESTLLQARTLGLGQARVDPATGSFQMTGIQPGAYTLLSVVSHSSARNNLERMAGSRFTTTTVQVQESETTEATIALNATAP